MDKFEAMEATQATDEGVVRALVKQGSRKPTGGAIVGDWMSRVGEAVTIFGMSFDDPRVMPLHSVVHYAAAGRNDDSYDGKWMVAAGDRQPNGANPAVVRLKPSYFEWRDVKLPADSSDSSPIATWYDTTTNREFFNPSDAYLENAPTEVPKLTLLPAAVAKKAVRHKWSPWQIFFVVYSPTRSK